LGGFYVGIAPPVQIDPGQNLALPVRIKQKSDRGRKHQYDQSVGYLSATRRESHVKKTDAQLDGFCEVREVQPAFRDGLHTFVCKEKRLRAQFRASSTEVGCVPAVIWRYGSQVGVVKRATSR
jgi:hypothetical protein